MTYYCLEDTANQVVSLAAIFTDPGCTQSRFLLTDTDCSGYSDGSAVKGITINC